MFSFNTELIPFQYIWHKISMQQVITYWEVTYLSNRVIWCTCCLQTLNSWYSYTNVSSLKQHKSNKTKLNKSKCVRRYVWLFIRAALHNHYCSTECSSSIYRSILTWVIGMWSFRRKLHFHHDSPTEIVVTGVSAHWFLKGATDGHEISMS